MNPKEFYDLFVARAVAESQSEPLNVRRATTALVELDNLLEHLIRHQNPTAKRQEIIAERERACVAHDFLGLARDVHDTHKHGRLARRFARITEAQKLETVHVGGGIGGGVGSGIGSR